MPIRLLVIALALILLPAIAVAATFGQTSNNGNSQSFSAARIYLSSASPATSGTITSATCRNWVSATGSYNSRVVVYADNGSTPNGGAKLAESDQLTISATTEAANTYNFTGGAQISVTAGTTYWFGIHGADPGTPSFVISRANTAGQVHFQSVAYGSAPANFTSGGTANGPHDCYITYTEATADVASPGLIVKDTILTVTDGALVKIN